MEVAMAALSDSAVVRYDAGVGMVMGLLTSCSTSGEMPFDSLPMTMISEVRKSKVLTDVPLRKAPRMRRLPDRACRKGTNGCVCTCTCAKEPMVAWMVLGL